MVKLAGTLSSDPSTCQLKRMWGVPEKGAANVIVGPDGEGLDATNGRLGVRGNAIGNEGEENEEGRRDPKRDDSRAHGELRFRGDGGYTDLTAGHRGGSAADGGVPTQIGRR